MAFQEKRPYFISHTYSTLPCKVERDLTHDDLVLCAPWSRTPNVPKLIFLLTKLRSQSNVTKYNEKEVLNRLSLVRFYDLVLSTT